tara:strand:- start:358 stop:525 length:168 start_codon:yes stop_codon:yes gene_type:complete
MTKARKIKTLARGAISSRDFFTAIRESLDSNDLDWAREMTIMAEDEIDESLENIS